MFTNWQYRLLALVLALACWYIVTGREKVETWAEVPVEIVNAPEDLVVRGGLPTSIKVRFRGSRALIRSLLEKPRAYSLNLSGLEPGENSVVFEKKNLAMPMTLEVVEIDPPRLTVSADRLVSRSLAVRPLWRGDPGEDYALARSDTVPAKVLVHGPQPVLDGMQDVPTLLRDVNATGAGEFSFDAGLALPESVTSDVPSVRVSLIYAPKTKAVWIRLPVNVVPADVGGRTLAAKPTSVQIQADVPLVLLRDKDFRDRFTVSAVAPLSLKEGRHMLPLSVQVPDGCILHKTVPEMVEVRIKKD